MPVVRYVKHYQKVPVSKTVSQRRVSKNKRTTIFHRIIPAVCMVAGLVLLGSVVVPMIGYELFVAPSLRLEQKNGNEAMIALAPAVNAREYLLPTPKPTPRVLEEIDYTDLSNWFPEETLPIVSPAEEKKYVLSIPAVNIIDAEVVLGGKNLDEHLIQYPGTANPGFWSTCDFWTFCSTPVL